jgi:methylated-DNA-[protein]-cysteine S-methyltransferase
VDLALATPFQREVLTALPVAAGYGRTATYGELARAVGRPAAARAVGGALNHNPLCVVVPCHRVVAASGDLTGYAGGLDAKRHLLALEAGAR